MWPICKFNAVLFVLGLFAIIPIALCQESPAEIESPNETEYAVNIAHAPFIGSYLVNENGYTLYINTNDATNKSSCYGQCAQNWASFHTSNITLPSELNKSDFGTLNRTDGLKQMTYKGRPLYRLFRDRYPGYILGDGVGGVWSVARPNSSIRVAHNASVGDYLTDADGMTLYYFKNDQGKGNSTCTESNNCTFIWPLFNAIVVEVPSGLNATSFTSFARADGRRQTAFMGWPLYYYAGDTVPGEMYGQGRYGLWYVINPTSFPPK